MTVVLPSFVVNWKDDGLLSGFTTQMLDAQARPINEALSGRIVPVGM
jgi:hypothetical protein